jgi:hypothetical protein
MSTADKPPSKKSAGCGKNVDVPDWDSRFQPWARPQKDHRQFRLARTGRDGLRKVRSAFPKI